MHYFYIGLSTFYQILRIPPILVINIDAFTFKSLRINVSTRLQPNIEFNIIDDDEILYCENSFTEGLVYPLPKVELYTLPLLVILPLAKSTLFENVL
jgi:hypothetical protein